MNIQEVRKFIAAENYKAALRGAKDFRIGVSKDQRSVMARAYESIVHPDFYQQIGIDTDKAIEDGICVLKVVAGIDR